MPVPGKRVCRAIHLFVGVSLVCSVCSRSLRGEDATAVGTVSKLNGSVVLERHGHTSTVALSAKVLLNDRFTTSESSSITISLVGGSELDVGQASSIRIDQHLVSPRPPGRSTVIGLLSGKLHSIVPYAQAQRSSFIVRTANAICGVRDTEFDTAYIEGKPCPGFPECKRYTDVGVVKGVVEVRSVTNPKALPVRVAEGYETTVPCEIPPSSPSPLGATELEAPGYH